MKTQTEQKNTQSKRKIFSGIVASDKMKDTVVVIVERFVKDQKYQKYVKSRKRYRVHDAGNTKKIGDKVRFEECAPISRDKKFRLIASPATAS